MMITEEVAAGSASTAIIKLEQIQKDNAFQKALGDIGSLLRAHKVSAKTIFISYAWEDETTPAGKIENQQLQALLQRIAKDLETVGARVLLDIEGMKGKMSGWMEQGIAESDYIILVGTPRYKLRASQETNVAFEYQRILTKLEQSDNQSLLLPLLYSGDFANAFPAGITEHLIRDFRRLESYYHHVLGLVKPLGLVPHIYPDLEKGHDYHQEYLLAFECFSNKLLLLEAEIKVLTAHQASVLPVVMAELPAASAYFVGRSEAMGLLKSRYEPAGLVTTVIQGMAGTGKSQLAAEYAYQSKMSDKPYRLIRWLKADSEEHAKQAYFSLGEDIGIKRQDYKDSEDAFKRAIDRQLLRYERVLLIYDNVEALEDIQAYQPRAAEGTTLHILLTTRRLFERDKVVIQEFNPADVQTYLQQRLGKPVTVALADMLGQALGYLPLAIVQSAAYMVKYVKSLESFLKLLEGSNREKALSADKELQPVSSLWQLTVQKLSEPALATLQLCAYLDPDNIPVSVLEAFIGEAEADEVLYELRSQSLLIEAGREGELLRIHRLLQEAVRRELSPEAGKSVIEKGIHALTAVIGQERYQPNADIELFWRARPFLSLQAHALIGQGLLVKIDEGLLATLYEWAGDYQRHITLNYALSLSLYQQALDIRARVVAESHPSMGDALYNLGAIDYIQARYNDALVHFEKALGIFKAVYGSKPHAAVASSLNNIGSVYYCQGQYTQALDYYEQSLVLRKAIYGANHPDVAASLNNIGMVYNSQGQYAQALVYHKQSLVLRKAIYGDNHPDVAASLNNIGNVYRSQGQYAQALDYFEQSLALRKAIYDDNHPNIATSLNNIGSVYYYQGQYTQALDYYEQSLAIAKAIYGANHPAVAVSLNNIGNVYYSQGQYAQALGYYEQSLALRKAIYGDNHPDVATSLNNIGSVYNSQGQYTQALDYYEQSLALRKAIYDANHPDVATSLNNISMVYNCQGQYAQALGYYEQSLAIYKAIHGDADSIEAVRKAQEASKKKTPKYSEENLKLYKAGKQEAMPPTASPLEIVEPEEEKRKGYCVIL